MNDQPLARRSRLLVERLDDEVLVYDQDANTAHCLRSDVAHVWEQCDGASDLPELARLTGLTEDTVLDGLGELERCGLLDSGQRAASTYSRRDATKRVAKLTVAAASAPLIYSMAIAPSAAMATPAACAASPCTGFSNNPGQNNGASTTTRQANAKAAADLQCRNDTDCRATSTCSGTNTEGGSGNNRTSTYNGFCVF